MIEFQIYCSLNFIKYNYIMRLWSLHPKYLDVKGLVALWREALLAKAVLEDKTIGYKKHPQLQRFKNHPYPLKAINYYLYYVYKEAKERNYKFNFNKIAAFDLNIDLIYLSQQEIIQEFNHLANKLITRDPQFYKKLMESEKEKLLHPLFKKGSSLKKFK